MAPKLSNRTILSDELLVHSSKTETLMRNTQNLLVFIQILRSSLAITELAFFAPLPKKTSLPAQASVNSHDFGFGLAKLRVLSRSFAAQTQRQTATATLTFAQAIASEQLMAKKKCLMAKIVRTDSLNCFI